MKFFSLFAGVILAVFATANLAMAKEAPGEIPRLKIEIKEMGVTPDQDASGEYIDVTTQPGAMGQFSSLYCQVSIFLEKDDLKASQKLLIQADDVPKEADPKNDVLTVALYKIENDKEEQAADDSKDAKLDPSSPQVKRTKQLIDVHQNGTTFSLGQKKRAVSAILGMPQVDAQHRRNEVIAFIERMKAHELKAGRMDDKKLADFDSQREMYIKLLESMYLENSLGKYQIEFIYHGKPILTKTIEIQVIKRDGASFFDHPRFAFPAAKKSTE